MTLPERVLGAGRAVLAAERDSLARTLGAFVSTFVGRPYLAQVRQRSKEWAGGRARRCLRGCRAEPHVVLRGGSSCAVCTRTDVPKFPDIVEGMANTAPLLDARARVKKIGALWEDQVRRVQAGEAARVRGHAIHVDENVDHELAQEADGFLNAAVRALKTGMQGVALELGVNIGFLFQKQASFEAGLGAL